MKPKIVFFDVNPEDAQFFSNNLNAQFDVMCVEVGLSDEAVPQIKDATVLSTHVSSKVTADIIAQLPNLKLVACRSTGFDNVDLAAAAARGIAVVNVPAYGEHTVAEYTMLLMLALSRKLLATTEAVRSGHIDPSELVGHDLNGKTLGVIGTGKIGLQVVRLAVAFGMTVIAFDPFPNAEAAAKLDYRYATLEDLLATSDIITIHAPATKESYHLLNDATLSHVQPHALIINAARGDIIDTKALITKLDLGQLGGAALDVMEGENFLDVKDELHLIGERQQSPELRAALMLDTLEKLPNVILTSHNAFNSAEALGRIRQTTFDNILAWGSGRPTNIVTQH